MASTQTSFTTQAATVSRFDDETIMLKISEGANIKVPEVTEFRDRILELASQKKFLLLIDISDVFFSSSNEAMKVFSQDSELVKLRVAQAIVVDNLAIKLLANFYIKVARPPGEAKLFKRMSEAVSWLSEQKQHLN
ncbi:MAG: hypothetical protein COB85_08035 [Bacteroidetes bacterium]|nr:MAG: hypothetical protein COB85_08035 [Bacteroidota bacterium]